MCLTHKHRLKQSLPAATVSTVRAKNFTAKDPYLTYDHLLKKYFSLFAGDLHQVHMAKDFYIGGEIAAKVFVFNQH